MDHDLLLKRLEKSFGFGDIVLKWFTSYLTNRTFIIRCCESETCMMHSSVGVLQGSVLGPLLFTLFTGDFEKLVMRHNLSFHQFAGDTQIYGHCRSEESLDLQTSLSECIDDIANWMEANHLKLNVSKTEVIWFSNGRSIHKIPNRPVRIVADNILLSKNVKTLGVWLDRDLSMKTHINMILKGGFISLRQMKSIKDLLSIEFLSRIDYGNIILARLPKYQKNRLQSLINTAARLITGTRKYDHMSPVLRNLHWLKIDERIDYKVLLLMFECLHNEDPAYLSKDLEMLSSIPSKQKLRSANSLKVVPGKS